jgi:hypothetical protein
MDGDDEGFEGKLTVFKLPMSALGKATIEKLLIPANERVVPLRHTPNDARRPRTTEPTGSLRHAMEAPRETRKRKRDGLPIDRAQEADSDSDVAIIPPPRVRKGAASKAPQESASAQSKPPTFTPKALHKRILNNCTLEFYADASTTTSRIRPYSACNTAAKLFGQARTAKIFSNGDFKVLSIQINGDETILCLAEADEVDFKVFIQTLKDTPCWDVDLDGRVSGFCTVQVREEK